MYRGSARRRVLIFPLPLGFRWPMPHRREAHHLLPGLPAQQHVTSAAGHRLEPLGDRFAIWSSGRRNFPDPSALPVRRVAPLQVAADAEPLQHRAASDRRHCAALALAAGCAGLHGRARVHVEVEAPGVPDVAASCRRVRSTPCGCGPWRVQPHRSGLVVDAVIEGRGRRRHGGASRVAERSRRRGSPSGNWPTALPDPRPRRRDDDGLARPGWRRIDEADHGGGADWPMMPRLGGRRLQYWHVAKAAPSGATSTPPTSACTASPTLKSTCRSRSPPAPRRSSRRRSRPGVLHAPPVPPCIDQEVDR